MRFTLAAAAVATAAATNPLELTVNNDGSYAVTVEGWQTFKSSMSAIKLAGTWVTPSNGLSPSVGSPQGGEDSWGGFNETTVTWSNPTAGAILATKFKVRPLWLMKPRD